jgi:hypothetical protein
MQALYTFFKASYLNEKVSCTDPSPSVIVPWLKTIRKFVRLALATFFSKNACVNESLLSSLGSHYQSHFERFHSGKRHITFNSKSDYLPWPSCWMIQHKKDLFYSGGQRQVQPLFQFGAFLQKTTLVSMQLNHIFFWGKNESAIMMKVLVVDAIVRSSLLLHKQVTASVGF